MRFPFHSAAAAAPALREPKPATFPRVAGLSIAAQYRGARTGGDFFDFLIAPSGHLVALLLDIAGPRLQAFDIAAYVQEEFQRRAPELFPDEELNESLALTELALETNRAIMQAAGGVRCAPAVIACLDPRLGPAWYINAGHTPALLKEPGGRVVQLAASGLPFGLFSHTTHDAQVSVVQPGATLVLVSKGLAEARSGGEEFGLDRVAAVLNNGAGASASALCEAVLAASDRFLASGPILRLPLPGRNHREADRTVLAIVRAAQ